MNIVSPVTLSLYVLVASLNMDFSYASLSERLKNKRMRLPPQDFHPMQQQQPSGITGDGPHTPSSRPTAHLMSPRLDNTREGGNQGGSYFPEMNAGMPSPTTPVSPYTHVSMNRDASSRPFLMRHVPHSPPAYLEQAARTRSHSFGRTMPRSSPAYQQSPPMIVPKKHHPLSPVPANLRPEPPLSAPEVATVSRTTQKPKQIMCPICKLIFGKVEGLQAHLDVHK